MVTGKKNPGQLVFGLDIGTRSIVGTVGYKTEETFHVIAQQVKEHDTRSMLDGQIHDIEKVGKTILEVKEQLEKKIGKKLNEVCIAAAGRVLKTITTQADLDFNEETVVDSEHIYTLEMLGIEKAYEEFQAQNELDVKFYCVGYTVVKYFLNGYPINSLEKHKAKKISVELIATFLPDEVVDGLYRAVEVANLQVANLTLEPIAAMQAAVPVMYRMLNIALVDVGAGTSDISITKDGSIIAYGMIPSAGDELTETIARHCLTDFAEAEIIKLGASKKSTIKFTDIMGLSQKIEPNEILKIVDPVLKEMTTEIANKIKELNGGKSVSAVFVVGGGGKLPGFTDYIAEELGILKERVALRGEEVLKAIDYQIDNPVRDSLFVTPIGICLNFYDQKNNFIFVNFNGKRVKLYDNGHLMVADAAMQAGFPNEGLFPKRGPELTFTVNDKPHMVRGELGEAAIIRLNGEDVSINAPIQAGDKIRIKESTEGTPASLDINQLPEYDSTISVIVNDKKILLPKFAQVNGNLQSGFYAIKEGDSIRMLSYYTVRQIAEFMDVILAKDMNIYVNNKLANLDTEVYENFAVIWTMEEMELSDVEREEAKKKEERKRIQEEKDYSNMTYAELNESEDDGEELHIRHSSESPAEILKAEAAKEEHADEAGSTEAGAEGIADGSNAVGNSSAEGSEAAGNQDVQASQEAPVANIDPEAGMGIMINGEPVILRGKKEYIFVDAFDYIDFDLSKPQGTRVVTTLNGAQALYMEVLKPGDVLEIYWAS